MLSYGGSESLWGGIMKKGQQRPMMLFCILSLLPPALISCASIDSFGPPVCSRFGETYGRSYPHRGTDYCVPRGTPVIAVADGEVRSAIYRKEDGNTVEIDHTKRLRTLYCHLSKLLVKNGQEVKRGDVIALSGNTGTLTGPNPHLHFQVIEVYPNHWKGKSVDPYPKYWFGGTGEPLAFNPNANYPLDRNVFVHPIAFGPYRSEAKRMAKEKAESMN